MNVVGIDVSKDKSMVAIIRPFGEVEMQYSAGDVYKGNWEQGQRSGKGVYLWNDGSNYRG